MNKTISLNVLQSTFRYCLIWIALSLGVFLFFNWSSISDPSVLPSYYGSQSIFGHGRSHLALYRFWTFYFPLAVIPYLIGVQVVLLIHLLFKKHLNLTKGFWYLVFIGFLLFCVFSDSTLHYIYQWLHIDGLSEWFYVLRDLMLALWFVLTLFLVLGSSLLMFIPQFKSYRKWLVLNISTVVLFLFYCYGYIRLFF